MEGLHALGSRDSSSQDSEGLIDITHVILDPCIGSVDGSCLEVCPTDAIYGVGTDPDEPSQPYIMVIDPVDCIDCFEGSTQVLVKDRGLCSLESLQDQQVEIMTDGSYLPAKISRFADQPLTTVIVKPAFYERSRGERMRLTTRNRSTFSQKLRVTSGHKWPLVSGETASMLEKGLFLTSSRAQSMRDSDTWKQGAAHGLVFGDGAWNKVEVRSGQHLHYVQLYGEKAGALKEVFEQVNFSPSCDIHPGYYGTGVVRAARNLKTVLPMTGDVDYLTGFFDGWLAADGSVDHRHAHGNWTLLSSNHAALAWAEKVAPLAGFTAIGMSEDKSDVTNFGPRTARIRSLQLTRRETFWRVMDVEQGRHDEPTYCATVPFKQEFTLAGGIQTHNCGACIIECPVDAIVSDANVPEKWGGFVKLTEMHEGRGNEDGEVRADESKADIAAVARELHEAVNV